MAEHWAYVDDLSSSGLRVGEFVSTGTKNHYIDGPTFAVILRFTDTIGLPGTRNGWMPYGHAFPVTSLLLLLRY